MRAEKGASFRGISPLKHQGTNTSTQFPTTSTMADSTEDLEPLFDYTRVQPRQVICLEDDEADTVPGPPGKKMKNSNYLEHANIIQLVDCEDNEEEDWLPPPPKVSKYDENVLMEDSTIKELRLKKKELESFAKSAENVFRAVEESVIRDIGNAVQPSSESELDSQTSKLSHERAKIVISIQDKNETKQIRAFMDEKFERLFKVYSDKHRIEREKLVFSFDGEKLSPGDTPNGLGMEDDDIIEVHVKSS